MLVTSIFSFSYNVFKTLFFLLGVRSHYRVVKDQPKGKILDSTHFKASADEKINKAQNIISVLAKMVKIVRKGEILASSLPFPKMFSKVVKTRNWWALKVKMFSPDTH